MTCKDILQPIRTNGTHKSKLKFVSSPLWSHNGGWPSKVALVFAIMLPGYLAQDKEKLKEETRWDMEEFSVNSKKDY